MEALIQLRDIRKSFGPVNVLQGVDMQIHPGMVSALVGDNGAGKSTLIKGLSGAQPYDSGEVLFEGRPVTLSSPHDASGLGIEVVYQDLALCENLDIVNNMFLGREDTYNGMLDQALMEKRATATLGVAQTAQVLALVRRLADQGVGVLIISHNLADVFEVCDYINVLYLGNMVAQLKTTETTYDDVIGYITGTKRAPVLEETRS